MDTRAEGNRNPVEGGALPTVKPPPDREVVAQIALNLTRANANPTNEKNVEAVQANIQSEGLTAFFHAAVQTLAAEQAHEIQAAQSAQATLKQVAPGEVSYGLPAITLPGFPAAPGDQAATRQTWQDCIGARIDQPLGIFYPTTLDELRSVLRQAQDKNCRVKAVGSGHSFTDVAGTRDFLVETHGLCQTMQPIDRSVLRPDARPETLFETEAGITIRALNEALWNAGFGLENMGGYDAQTIAGVVSTSTHGSGMSYGPLSSQVVSLTVVAAGGRTMRIEPAHGITDPAAWTAHHPDIELKQDNQWFQACQVGLGCMGIIHSVVLRVRPRYYLREQRRLSNWFQVRDELRNGQVLRDNLHYEVLVNPYATLPGGNHTCLVTRRNPVPMPVDPPLLPPTRNILIELAGSVPGPSRLLLSVLNSFHWLTPNIIDEAMKAIVGDYIDRSYRVFNIGNANEVPAFASEIGFPMSNYLNAVECILEIARLRQSVGQAYLNSPFSMRFVKASPAYLSMMYATDTCMVELITLDHTVGGKELLQDLETKLYSQGGRPHWGLLNFLSGAGGLIKAMYPQLHRWQAVRSELDPNGQFANAFSERCGLTPLTFVRG